MTNVNLSNRRWNFFDVTDNVRYELAVNGQCGLWTIRNSHNLTVLMAISSSARKNSRLRVNYRLIYRLDLSGYSSQYNPVCNLYVLGTYQASMLMSEKRQEKGKEKNGVWISDLNNLSQKLKVFCHLNFLKKIYCYYKWFYFLIFYFNI